MKKISLFLLIFPYLVVLTNVRFNQSIPVYNLMSIFMKCFFFPFTRINCLKLCYGTERLTSVYEYLFLYEYNTMLDKSFKLFKF